MKYSRPSRKESGAVGAHDLAKFLEEFRLAIRGEAHHFVFIAKFPEAEILRQRRVVHAERMRERDFAEHLHARAFADRPHGARKIAEAVGGEHGGAFERRNEIRAGEVRGVVLDPMELRADTFGRHFKRRCQILADSREASHHARAFECKSRHAHRETQFRSQPRLGIARNRDVIDFGEFRAGLVEAILNRARRQARGVLHAIQPLFFDRREELAVDDDRRRSIRVIGVDAENDHFRMSSVSRNWIVLQATETAASFRAIGISREVAAEIPLYPLIQYVETPGPRPRRPVCKKIIPNLPRLVARPRLVSRAGDQSAVLLRSARAAPRASNSPTET